MNPKSESELEHLNTLFGNASICRATTKATHKIWRFFKRRRKNPSQLGLHREMGALLAATASLQGLAFTSHFCQHLLLRDNSCLSRLKSARIYGICAAFATTAPFLCHAADQDLIGTAMTNTNYLDQIQHWFQTIFDQYGNVLALFIFIIVSACIVLLPTIIAFKRGAYHKHGIMLVNIFLCGTGIGYLFALLWALYDEKGKYRG